jgi:Tol biopolymer transport system component
MRAILLLVGSLLLVGCTGDRGVEITEAPPPVSGPYLGKAPPGATPQLFLATVLAERDAAWTPDGTELVHSLYEQNRGVIVVRRAGPEGWSAPEFASFGSGHSELEPFVTADGRWLYYISKRPLPGETQGGDYNLWRVPRVDGDWGSPEPLPAPINTDHEEFYPSLTAAGELCFTSDRPGGLGGEDIWCAAASGDGWTEPVNLGAAVNSAGPEFNSLIAPDGSWLIFGAVREGDVGGGDLHIAFRGPDGELLPAVNMGEPVNSSTLDYCPALSPDGGVLFFTSNRVPPDVPEATTYAELEAAATGPANGRDNVWWVSATVIDGLRDEVTETD